MLAGLEDVANTHCLGGLTVERKQVVVDATLELQGVVVAHISDFHYDFGLEVNIRKSSYSRNSFHFWC